MNECLSILLSNTYYVFNYLNVFSHKTVNFHYSKDHGLIQLLPDMERARVGPEAGSIYLAKIPKFPFIYSLRSVRIAADFLFYSYVS